MELNGIKPAAGARRARRRVGRGIGSGLGKTAGRGHKGQKSRAGGYHKVGFEGGQMPLHRRLPKKGFSNAMFRTEYEVFNLDRLSEVFDDGAVINEQGLRDKNLLRGQRGQKWDGIKILGDGDVTKKFTFEVDKVSQSAREKIEKAGGTINLLERTPKAPKAKAKAEAAA